MRVLTFEALAASIRGREARCGGVRLVAVDGPGGAGKSVFAARLARALGDVPVVHTDDFASWDNPHGWWDRFETQVLGPLERGDDVRYQRYDWNEQRLGAWLAIPRSDVVIIEGVSSSRAAARERLSMAVWIETDRDERLRRGIERDGESMRPMWHAWMAQEDAFFERDGTRDRADTIVSGSPTVAHEAEREFIAVGGTL